MVLLMDYDRYIRVKHLDRYQEQFNGSKIHRYLMLIHLHNSSFHIKCNYLSRYHNFFIAFTIAASSAADIFLQGQLRSY